MHAQLSIDGGLASFPGLARPIQLDEQELSSDERAEFARLVASAHAEAASNAAARLALERGKPVPDGRTYRIDVAGGETVRISAADPGVPPAFAALMAFMKQHGRR